MAQANPHPGLTTGRHPARSVRFNPLITISPSTTHCSSFAASYQLTAEQGTGPYLSVSARNLDHYDIGREFSARLTPEIVSRETSWARILPQRAVIRSPISRTNLPTPEFCHTAWIDSVVKHSVKDSGLGNTFRRRRRARPTPENSPKPRFRNPESGPPSPPKQQLFGAPNLPRIFALLPSKHVGECFT